MSSDSKVEGGIATDSAETPRQVSEYFRELIEHVLDLITVIDREGNILYQNPSVTRVLGYRPEEVSGRNALEFIHPDDLQRVRDSLTEVLQTRGVTSSIEYRVRHKNGSWRIVEAIGNNLLDTPTGIGIVVNARDITEYRRAAAQRATALRTLDNIMRTIPDIVYVLDQDARLVRWNRRMELVTGLLPAQLMGRPAVEFFPDSERARVAAAIAEAYASGYGEVEGDFLAKDGRCIPYHWTGAPLRDEHGAVIGLTGAGRDISERKQAEALLRRLHEELEQRVEERTAELQRAKDAAERATRTRSQFLANMSHEVRTPLTGVLGMTDLLLSTPLSEQQRQWLNVIRQSGTSLLLVLNDILDFSKIESGSVVLESVPFDLRQHIDDCLALIAPKATAKGIATRCVVDPSVPQMLVGDATRTRQILVNLLSNAVKFTSAGEIVVSAASRPLAPADASDPAIEVQVAVSDTGVGIPRAQFEHLFQPFRQLDSSTTRRAGGTGLGLAISKGLATLMGGTIWADSEVARGSTFHFTMRVARADAMVPQECAGDMPGVFPYLADRFPLRVLLADDDAVTLQVITETLRRLGYEPDVARNGIEVIEAVARRAYDVVLLDVQMPEMDGLEAARRICRRWPNQRPRLIAVTAHTTREYRQACQAAGIDDFLSKPLEVNALCVALERCAVGSPPSLTRDNGSGN
jgi:PAS domain S-box-containing protein